MGTSVTLLTTFYECGPGCLFGPLRGARRRAVMPLMHSDLGGLGRGENTDLRTGYDFEKMEPEGLKDFPEHLAPGLAAAVVRKVEGLSLDEAYESVMQWSLWGVLSLASGKRHQPIDLTVGTPPLGIPTLLPKVVLLDVVTTPVSLGFTLFSDSTSRNAHLISLDSITLNLSQLHNLFLLYAWSRPDKYSYKSIKAVRLEYFKAVAWWLNLHRNEHPSFPTAEKVLEKLSTAAGFAAVMDNVEFVRFTRDASGSIFNSLPPEGKFVLGCDSTAAAEFLNHVLGTRPPDWTRSLSCGQVVAVPTSYIGAHKGVRDAIDKELTKRLKEKRGILRLVKEGEEVALLEDEDF